MSALVLNNLSPTTLAYLTKRAAERNRTPEEEAARVLEEAARGEQTLMPRWPDFLPGEEIPAPFDLPRSSQPLLVQACPGRPRLPDPLPDAAEEATP